MYSSVLVLLMMAVVLTAEIVPQTTTLSWPLNIRWTHRGPNTFFGFPLVRVERYSNISGKLKNNFTYRFFFTQKLCKTLHVNNVISPELLYLGPLIHQKQNTTISRYSSLDHKHPSVWLTTTMNSFTHMTLTIDPRVKSLAGTPSAN